MSATMRPDTFWVIVITRLVDMKRIHRTHIPWCWKVYWAARNCLGEVSLWFQFVGVSLIFFCTPYHGLDCNLAILTGRHLVLLFVACEVHLLQTWYTSNANAQRWRIQSQRQSRCATRHSSLTGQPPICYGISKLSDNHWLGLAYWKKATLFQLFHFYKRSCIYNFRFWYDEKNLD